MKIIQYNPFRVLGLLANASERAIQKNRSIIQRYAEIGKSKDFENDFGVVGTLSRTEHDVSSASSKIEQGKNKVRYSNFWFVNQNPVDEIALNHLRDGDLDGAIETWEKVVVQRNISRTNYSCVSNIGTALLLKTTQNGSFEKTYFERGLKLKGILLESPLLKTYNELIGGSTTIFDASIIAHTFIDDILKNIEPYLGKRGGITYLALIKACESLPLSAQNHVVEKLTSGHVRSIKSEIQRIENAKDQDPQTGFRLGKELNANTKGDLNHLKKVLGTRHIRYQLILNQVAELILQCAIDYFNELIEANRTDPSHGAYELVKLAQDLNPTGKSKDRIEEHVEIFKDWAGNAEERSRVKKVQPYMEAIGVQLETANNGTHTTQLASRLISLTQGSLSKMRTLLGSSNQTYIEASDAIVTVCLNILISAVNAAQQITLDYATSTVNEAIALMSRLSSFDISYSTKQRLDKNLRIVRGIKTQLNGIRKQKSGACYIATMAYGDYAHPQVFALRKFRDQVLAKSFFGRVFIKLYYATSPKLVQYLKNKTSIHAFIRKALDQFIKHLS